jgi:hypothetical protein
LFSQASVDAIRSVTPPVQPREPVALSASLATALTQMFREGHRPSTVAGEHAIPDGLAAEGLSQLAKKTGVPATKQEIEECLTLLETGQAFKDLSSVSAAALQAVPGFIRAFDLLLKDPEIIARGATLGAAIKSDAAGAPTDALRSLRVFVSTRQPPPSPRLLTRTLSQFYEIAPAAQALTLVRHLLDRDNRSIRLALILYARANGVSISDDDIDAVWLALDPQDPNLGVLMAPALRQLLSRYGNEAGAAILKQVLSQKP